MTSVIVPVHNAAPFIGELLRSLSEQKDALDWEVILVDNNSTDESMTIARRWADKLPLRLLTATERSNPSYARNVGAAAASGDNLLFIDADDAVDGGYVRAMRAALELHPFVTSRVDSETLNPAWAQNAHGAPWQTDHVGVFFGFLPAAGANIGIKRALFQALGGFSGKFSGSEDVAFSWEAQLATGTSVRFVPDAVYRYRYRTTYWQLFAQGRQWGRDSALLYRTFRTKGMPGRPLSLAARDWVGVLAGLIAARSRAARAPLLVRLGFCVGRLKGSALHRVPYF
jgi:glycosyltransferase involved in cell wall biosynthesis